MNPELAAIETRLRTCLPHLVPHIADDDQLASLAFDSLDTVEFLCAVHHALGIRLTEDEFHPTQTLSGLAAAIAAKTPRSMLI